MPLVHEAPRHRGPALGHAVYDGPTLVIGDIHGRADLLGRLLDEVPDAAVVVVGDVIDRGPDAAGVIERLVARGAVGSVGNHEGWFIAWLLGAALDWAALHPAMGARATLAAYGVSVEDALAGRGRERIPAHHRAWLTSLPVALDLTVAGERFWVVHAGISPSERLHERPPDDVVPHLATTRPAALLWPKTDPRDSLPVDRPVIMGHVAIGRAEDHGHTIALDTGCGHPRGALTGLLLPERRFIRVS